MEETKLTLPQSEALKSFLLVKCRRFGCDGPWCSVQKQLEEAFDLTSWKIKRDIDLHHEYIKEKSDKLQQLATAELSESSLREIAQTLSEIGAVGSCLYHNHFEEPRVEISRDEDDYKEKMAEAIGARKNFVITNKDGFVMSSHFVGCCGFEQCSASSLCPVC